MKSKYLYDVVCVCCQSVPRVASVRTVLCSVCVRITAHVTEWQEAAAVSRDITVISVNTVRSTRSSFREVCCVLTVCVFQRVPPVCSALAVSSAATVWTGLHVTPEPDSASVPLDHTALAVREVRRSSCTSTHTPPTPTPTQTPLFLPQNVSRARSVWPALGHVTVRRTPRVTRWAAGVSVLQERRASGVTAVSPVTALHARD